MSIESKLKELGLSLPEAPKPVAAYVPAVMTVTGPMLTGSWKGEELGACTDCRRLWGLHRGDEITLEEVEEAGNFLMRKDSSFLCEFLKS